LYTYQPAFVLGFHGCDAAVGESVLAGKEALAYKENNYDWLGHGAYFWEQNPKRALEFARHIKGMDRADVKKIKEPFVIGAVISLGRCLNLLDSLAIDEVKAAYNHLLASGKELPENKPNPKENGTDLIFRFLDCAVIETLHSLRVQFGEEPYETARGAFFEGDRLYPGAGFREKNHIQICVREMNCIKGYFRLPEDYWRRIQ